MIGDTLTFCSAQITAMVIHKAWHLCLPHLSPSLLSRKQLFVIKLFPSLLQTANLHRGVYFFVCVFLCVAVTAATGHMCACNIERKAENRRKGLSGHFILTVGAICVCNTVLIRADTDDIHKNSLKKQCRCVSVCFCGCVNHTSTQRSIQFLMGPPGLHSSSLLIFSCFPFCTPRGWDVSIGPGW